MPCRYPCCAGSHEQFMMSSRLRIKVESATGKFARRSTYSEIVIHRKPNLSLVECLGQQRKDVPAFWHIAISHHVVLHPEQFQRAGVRF